MISSTDVGFEIGAKVDADPSKVRVLKGKVLVKRDVQEMRTSGGIILPKGEQQVKDTGIVVSVGEVDPGKGLECEVGDRVYWEVFQGFDLVMRKESYSILDAEKILFVIEG